MRSALLLSSVLCASTAFAAVGCSSRDDKADEDSSAVATTAEIALARQAVGFLAGAQGRCTTCHTATRSDIARWGEAMQAVERDCLAPGLELSPGERIACLSDDPSDPESWFSATKLGLYAAGARHAELRALFAQSEDGEARYGQFELQAAMPSGGPGLTEEQFATVKSWVLGGMRGLDEAISDPELGPCRPSTNPALAAHLREMKSDGWGARLADSSTTMYGCGDSKDARACLADLEDITAAYTAPGAEQTLRRVRDLPFRSRFWVRSSADGRYAGFGASPAKIIDLTTAPTARAIDVSAAYDPAFFPNNDGFTFAGASGGIRACRQGVIEAAAQMANPRITMQETGCSTITGAVYQSIGGALDGSLYWMTIGRHVNDFGGPSGPPPGFTATAETTFIPMLSDGVSYLPRPSIKVPIPYEGEHALSPSSKLLVNRFGSSTGTRGLRVRRLITQATPAGGFTVDTEELATICLNATKTVVSFDERFIVTHQYVDPVERPDLPPRTSNIFLIDLATAETFQLTQVAAGQNALFPHFRADGWIYFLMKDQATGKETLVASDAALHRPALVD